MSRICMAARPKEVIDKLRETLIANLTDPNPTRRSEEGNWIYTTPIKLEAAMYPRIHIQEMSNNVHEGLSVGSTKRLVRTIVRVNLFWGLGDKFDVEGDDEVEQEDDALDKLAEDVVAEINDNQTTWRGVGDGIHSLLTITSGRTESPRSNVIRHRVEAELLRNT